jgi:hypothetical protein
VTHSARKPVKSLEKSQINLDSAMARRKDLCLAFYMRGD